MQTIIVHPKNQEELQFVTQLMKRMKIKAAVIDEQPKQRKKQEILEGLERSVDQMNAHLRGEIKLRSADELLNEL
ncbi:DUF2683 family protein [Fibrisoma limi]|uniref:DUF2683 family protein n=1 Tax=Fibrisoma limi TaxID=663275 RepID=UPI000587EA3E|nr:DUF2683 family protein [Fibrisoma limi]